MFTINIFYSELELISRIVSTIVVGIVFIAMSVSYTKKRAKRNYGLNRVSAPSIPSFNLISKGMFISSMILTLISFWFESTLFLTLYNSLVMQIVGSVLVLLGYFNLSISFKQLDCHYSPSFDAYIPHKLVKSGIYQYIRHPIYLFNLFISFGLAIASGSALVMAIAVLGLLYIIKIIAMEEKYLTRQFPEYASYSDFSWKLVPFFY